MSIYSERKVKKYFAFQKKKLHLQSQTGDGALAQSVEQRTENPCVAGSIPAGTTKKTSTKVGVFCV
jgi:hypothetical protein